MTVATAANTESAPRFVRATEAVNAVHSVFENAIADPDKTARIIAQHVIAIRDVNVQISIMYLSWRSTPSGAHYWVTRRTATSAGVLPVADAATVAETEADARRLANELWTETVRQRDATRSAPRVRTVTSRSVDPALTPGVYETDGQIYVVRPNKSKTRLYAKKLVERPNVQRLTSTGDVVAAEYIYAPGAIYRIKPEHRMTVDRAHELTLRYGQCVACGRRLKAAQSVARGIGPVCARNFR